VPVLQQAGCVSTLVHVECKRPLILTCSQVVTYHLFTTRHV